MTTDSNATPSYEEICEWGKTAVEHIDKGRWIIGDLALEVKKCYGANMMEDFARKINVAHSTVKQYRKVSAFYPSDTRVSFLESAPTVSYSHMREAMRFRSLDAARRFLEECAENDWTVERASIEVKKRLGEPIPPRRLLDTIGRLVRVDIQAGQHPRASIILDDGVDIFALDRCEGLAVRLVVYEEREEARDDALPLQVAG